MKISAIALLLPCTLAACVQPPPPLPEPVGPPSLAAASSAGQSIEVSQSKVALIAKAVLAGLEASAAAYVLSAPPSAADQAAIVRAEVLAEAYVNRLNASRPGDFAGDLIVAANAINAFAVSIPNGRVAASVTAGIAALATMVETVAPLLASPATPALKPAIAVRIVA